MSADLTARRDRELATARGNVGKARQNLARYEHALSNLEGYWAQYPAETVRERAS